MILDKIDEIAVIVKPLVPVDNSSEWSEQAYGICEEIAYRLDLLNIFGNMRNGRNLTRWYNHTYEFGFHPFVMYVAYCDFNPCTGVFIKFSAQALSYYMDKSSDGTDPYVIIADMIHQLNVDGLTARLSRIDIAIDYIDEGVNLTELYKDLQSERVQIVTSKGKKNRSKKKAIYADGECRTIYIGQSRQKNARALLRIYDKKHQQLSQKKAVNKYIAMTCNSWTRMEAEFHEEYSNELTEELLKQTGSNLRSIMISSITDKYRFIDATTGENLMITQVLLEEIESRFHFSARKEINPDLYHSFSYLCKSSGLFPLMYKVKFLWGEEGLTNLMNEFAKEWSEYTPNNAVFVWLRKYAESLQLEDSPFGGDYFLKKDKFLSKNTKDKNGSRRQ